MGLRTETAIEADGRRRKPFSTATAVGEESERQPLLERIRDKDQDQDTMFGSPCVGVG